MYSTSCTNRLKVNHSMTSFPRKIKILSPQFLNSQQDSSIRHQMRHFISDLYPVSQSSEYKKAIRTRIFDHQHQHLHLTPSYVNLFLNF
jgi:hypothetical protein